MGGYLRVMPRDLFNEGSLLTLHGRLVILLKETADHHASIAEQEVEGFDVVQDPATGWISIDNFVFTVRGRRYRLSRPLNSRERWPLWLEDVDQESDFEAIAVFDDDGALSPEMLSFIKSPG